MEITFEQLAAIARALDAYRPAVVGLDGFLNTDELLPQHDAARESVRSLMAALPVVNEVPIKAVL